MSSDFDLTVFRSEDEIKSKTRVSAHQSTTRHPRPSEHRRTVTLSPIEQPSPGSAPSNASLSIADLLENNVRLDWQESVGDRPATLPQDCARSAAKIQRSAIEPWNVEITQTGNVEVLPGGTSRDPLVQQVGRVLGSLLHESIAPAELRLVAAQASFDVPVFSSVEELASALRRFERPGETEAIRAAFHRGVEAKFSTESNRAPESKLWARSCRRRAQGPAALDSKPPGKRGKNGSLLRIVAAVVGAASLVWFSVKTASRCGSICSGGSRHAIVSLERQSCQDSNLGRFHDSAENRRRMHSPGDTISRATIRLTSRGGASLALERRPRIGSIRGSGSQSNRARGAAHAVVPSTSCGRATRHGAARSGLRDEASIVFDSIVFRDPLHRFNPASVTADALAVFKRSKQLLLPSLAAHEYEAARAAFDGSDYARAVAGTERAATLLEDPDLTVVPADLRADVSRLHASAIAARTTLEDKIYSSADLDVSPPRPVGRRLPALPPAGLTAKTTGRLEILINRAGQVEAVKLHSPLNAYHDRMIVSAAKAWRYRPALLNGKPVRFSLGALKSCPNRNSRRTSDGA